MHRLLELLMSKDLFMSFRPDITQTGKDMVVGFRKTLCNGQTYNRTYRLTDVEVNRLGIDIDDVIIEFAERFLRDFENEDTKFWS